MNGCTAFRWRIPAFLSGNLPADMMEEVREHLDCCADCAVVMAHPARVEAADISRVPALPEDFTERLMKKLPSSFTGQKLAAFVALAFLASGAFGVAIWAGIKWLFGRSTELASTTSQLPAAKGSGLFQSLTSSTSLEFIGLGVAAIVVCLIVIAIVDRPQAAEELSKTQS